MPKWLTIVAAIDQLLPSEIAIIAQIYGLAHHQNVLDNRASSQIAYVLPVAPTTNTEHPIVESSDLTK